MEADLIDLGPHAFFIVASYAAAGSIVLLLIVWVMIDRRRQQKMLARLEAQGIVRRSDRAAPQGEPT